MDAESRGKQAQRIIDDELFMEAITALDRAYVAAWRNGRTVEAREDAHRYMILLNRFVSHFKEIAQTGELARREREAIEGKKRFWVA